MKLYPIPGGTWAGTEADWKKAMKARGLDPKAFEATKTREVPTAKADLMEFLNFFGVDVYRTGDAAPTTVSSEPTVDVEALRREHNPDAPDLAPPPAPAKVDTFDLDELFTAAPVGQQLRLAVVAIDAAHAAINAK